MVKKKVDPRIRGLIEHGVRKNHRSLFILVGDHGKDQVENIHRILSKARVRSRPSVLWCYKKELGFSTHRKKRIQEIKKLQNKGLYDNDRDDPFELFISSTNIRWSYYKEADKILGQTFGMCVLQDFEAITPNLLARTIETVEGGGIVILLLKTVKSLKQLYTLSMDVHNRFRTEAHHEIVPRFNERFILSLGQCENCLVLDDELNILPISSKVNYVPSYQGDNEGLEEGDADLSGFYVDPELNSLKASLRSTPHVSNLVEVTKTLDQAKTVISFLDTVSEKTFRSTVSLTAGRGRGKSAAIGLCLAGSISFGYSNVFVTAPSPENLKTCFEFIIIGLKALKYVEHLDFEIVHEHVPDVGKLVVRINIFKTHRQTIQYILPTDYAKLAQAELLAIDEAAAIPLPIVKNLLGPYLVFISSTVNGYEGTGRSLSLKLIQQLRIQQSNSITSAAQQAGSNVSGKSKNDKKVHEDRWRAAAESAASYSKGGEGTARKLVELSLEVPIRYSSNDPVEKWLNNLLCLDITANSTRMLGVMPAPKDCELYIVDRDALFSYHELAEAMLQRIWALYTAAHYKNSPNDLHMLSDAPAHRLFVLLGPQNGKSTTKTSSGLDLPDILCVVQVAFEGKISAKSVQSELSKGNKANGDLIPWTISQQFNDSEFATLSGARIVRIATHPDLQKMGYGSRAVDLLISYFQGELTIDTLKPSSNMFGGEGAGTLKSEKKVKSESKDKSLLDEEISPNAKLPPLLTPIYDRPAERLHYLGVSFGLTSQLINFWSRKGFRICYLRQTANDLTGEHSCIVLRELDCSNLNDDTTPASGWLTPLIDDYRKRMVSLMSYSLRKLDSPLALSLLDPEKKITSASAEDADEGEFASDLTKRDPNLVSANEILSVHINYHDLKRLELYARNMVDHHMILDLVPALCRLLFLQKLGNVRVSFLQAAILVAIGLQHRDVDDLTVEMDLPSNQVLAFFNKSIRKLANFVKNLVEKEAAKELISNETVFKIGKQTKQMVPLKESLSDNQKKDELDFKSEKQKLIMAHPDLNVHKLDVDEGALTTAVSSSLKKQQAMPSLVSLPKTLSDTPAKEDGSSKKRKSESFEGGSAKKDKKKNKKSKD